MNPKLLAALLVPAVIVVTVVAVVLAGGGDDDSEDQGAAAGTPTPPGTIVTAPTLTPTPTLETAPDATPTPVKGPEGQARDLTLRDSPDGLLQYVSSGPYVVPGDAFGIFYLDIETGQIAGWHDLIGNTLYRASSGDNRFSVFERQEQVTRGGVIYPAGTYLADRETRRVYRWDGDAELVLEEMSISGGEIASRGDLVLFRIPVEDGDDWFGLLDIARNEAVATFQAEATWGVISEDGNRMALAGEDVFVVEVSTGDVERIAQGALGSVDLEGDVELMNSRDGESFLVLTKPAKLRFSGIALRYTWEGDQLSEVAGMKIFPSPGGDYVAAAEPVVILQEQPALAIPWFTFYAYDTTDGSELFRVVGVLADYGFNAGNRWLADGSGLVVRRADRQLAVAHRDGQLMVCTHYHQPGAVRQPAIAGVKSVVGNHAYHPELLAAVRGVVGVEGEPWDGKRRLLL